MSKLVNVTGACRPSLDGFEVVRTEDGGSSPFELSLLNLKRPAQIEFYSGNVWSGKPPASQARPAALRITLDGQTITIR
jgi:hypothetical protein